MKFSLLILPLFLASCAAHHNAHRKIASEELNVPVKASFTSSDNEMKDDEVFPIITNLSFIMSNLQSGMGDTSMKVTFPTNKASAKSIKLKRVFIFSDRMESKQKLQNFMSRILHGDKPGTLKFMKELSVRIVPSQSEEKSVVIEQVTRQEVVSHKQALSAESGTLIKYDSKNISSLPLSSVFLFKSKDPAETKRFIDKVISDRSVESFEIIEDVVVVELKKDPIIEQSFIATMSNYSEKLEELGVSAIDQCTKETCIDLKVSDENLAPLFKEHNALTLEAFIKTFHIPNTMKIKGQIEFEVRLSDEF